MLIVCLTLLIFSHGQLVAWVQIKLVGNVKVRCICEWYLGNAATTARDYCTTMLVVVGHTQ